MVKRAHESALSPRDAAAGRDTLAASSAGAPAAGPPDAPHRRARRVGEPIAQGFEAAWARPPSPVTAGAGGQRADVPDAHRQTPALDACDLELAAYLLAREAVDRRVPTPTRHLLTRANQSKKEVLDLMRYGRSNVLPDLEATRNEGFHRLLAQRRVAGDVSSLGEDAGLTYARDAAFSAYAGSGNCGEFANVAAHLHAARLRDGERLTIVRSDECDHSWVALRGSADGRATPPQAIIDAWAEGPVVEPQDNGYIAEADVPPVEIHRIDGAEAATAFGRFDAIRRHPDDKPARRFELLTETHRRDGRQPTGTVYEPTALVSDEFCESARSAIESHPAPQQLAQRAAALAQEVAGLPAPNAQAAAAAIIERAANLDAVQARRLEAPRAHPDDHPPSADSD